MAFGELKTSVLYKCDRFLSKLVAAPPRILDVSDSAYLELYVYFVLFLSVLTMFVIELFYYSPPGAPAAPSAACGEPFDE